MRRKPSEPSQSITQVAASRYFTNREGFIEAFMRYIHAGEGDPLRVLVFYGVGGVGKTTLVQKLCEELKQFNPPVPYTRVDLESVGAQALAHREVLIRLRTDLESHFGVQFPRFDLCWAMIVAREGGDPPPLIRTNPNLRDALEFASVLFQAPLQGLDVFVERTVLRFPVLEKWVRQVGGTKDVLELRDLAMHREEALHDELIRRFAQDLQSHLKPREGKACKGVLFLDTYEALWTGREGGNSAQARLLDEWVRQLAEYCLEIGVLLVISGRDRLLWADDDLDWNELLDQHLLGGLSSQDAQAFLAKCGIGEPPDQPASPLQEAIINCCDTEPGPSLNCHPLYLALCAEIVLNTRHSEGSDPSPELFRGIPSQRVATELATRFLKSLHSRAMELWVTELSLTPRFDEASALALDTERQHHNGRAGWERLKGFSFVEPLPNGFYTLHKTMRDVLRARIAPSDATKVHQWFRDYWQERDELTLHWFHRWTLDSEETLREWTDMHKTALSELRIAEARRLLVLWSEIELDDADRRRLGDKLWAETHFMFGYVLWKTPTVPRSAVMKAAIEHYQAALRVFTEADFPQEWAMTQLNLGNAYADLLTGDRLENLQQAMACYQAALRVYTEADFPREWAGTQRNLGTVYLQLPMGDRLENLQQAMACYQAALRVFTEADFPQDWARTQHNLGTAY
ncbi:MAG: hypothetical protein SNJ72_09305, partial [Fimbriimonadales bacterium]